MADWEKAKEDAEDHGEYLESLQERVEQQAVDIKRLKRALNDLKEDIEEDTIPSEQNE